MYRLTNLIAGLLTLAALAAATPLAAQQRGRAEVRIPKGYEPPRGMCRIWLEGVPAGQQPAPTDCATAIRKRPANAAVVFGEPVRSGTGGDRTPPVVRPLAPERREPRREVTPTPRREERQPERRAEPRAEPRTERQPERAERQPERREETGRRRVPERPRTPPDGGYEDALASARWLDEELLAALYDPGRSERGTEMVRSEGGRATPRTGAGERGRSVVGGGGAALAPDGAPLLDWARGVDGRSLSAREVELLLRYGGPPLVVGAGGALPDDGLVRARPGECYDRDFDGRCDDLSAGADGCYDANRDGRCDDLRWDYPGDRRLPERDAYGRDPYGRDPYGRDRARADDRVSTGLCFDRDRDGRCDEPWSDGRRIPQTLPEMAAAAGLQRGVASYDVERWLRRSDVSARITDRDRDGVPERVVWLDTRGQVVQVWTDRDGDGIADRVELYRDGLPVQVIER